MTDTLKSLFMLEPGVVFLNHGSFGATPKPVFEVYQEWQRRLEQQPVRFLGREVNGHLAEAKTALGRYLNVASDDLGFVTNATFGVNIAARSLALGPGDVVLTSDQEYGACNNVWAHLGQKRGFSYRHAAIPLPTSPEEMLEAFWSAVTDRTKVVYLSHITSPTAQTLPILEICARCREAGILTIIDGAHAPGQLELDLHTLGADIYTGNLHKWLCSPKGAGFLYVRPDKQHLIEPLVVSWGWSRGEGESLGSSFLDNLGWVGTEDVSRYLAVPAAIAFQHQYDWPSVRQECHALLRWGLEQLCETTGLPLAYLHEGGYAQLAISPLPVGTDVDAFQKQLYEMYNVEIPLTQHLGQPFLRISVQGYNSKADMESLVGAVGELLGTARSAL
jgi:isopenicillin-N epimerase